MNRQSLALAALSSLTVWLMATHEPNLIRPPRDKELRCISLDKRTIEEMEKDMTHLVFSSRSTVVTGLTQLKDGGKSSLTGYACGW